MAYCERHKVEYKAKVIKLFGKEIQSPCPHCDKELLQERERAEKEKLAKIEAERLKQAHLMASEYLNASGMPKRFLNRTFAISGNENFKKYENYLKTPIKRGVLYVSGNIGVGKTCFVCEIVKFNALKKPLFLYASELCTLTKSDFSVKHILDSVQKSRLIVIDECNYFTQDSFIFDLIVDICYRDDLPLILIGNSAYKNFSEKIQARTQSRLSEKIEFLEFVGKDLRIN